MTTLAPRVVWRERSGHASHAGVVVPLDAPPPIASLASASTIEWIPALRRSLVIQDGARRAVTEAEGAALARWLMRISTDALAARDGAGPALVVVIEGAGAPSPTRPGEL